MGVGIGQCMVTWVAGLCGCGKCRAMYCLVYVCVYGYPASYKHFKSL